MKLFAEIDRYNIPGIENSLDESVDLMSAKPVIICYKEEYGEPEMMLLTKILAAIELTPDECTIILLNEGQHFEVNKIRSETTRNIICFGVNPKVLGLQIDIKVYHRFSLYHKTLLFCHSLFRLNSDLDAKKALWAELKSKYI